MRVIKDVRYSSLYPVNLDIYLPDAEEFDVFIYFHGGGLSAGMKDDDCIVEFSTQLAQNGIAAISADYRMYPEASFPDFIKDAAAAVAYAVENMETYGKPKRFFVGGSSAGGYISMMLCFDKRFLAPYEIDPASLGGFIHDAGQPTSHFNVLREKGIDTRRVVVDETAPLFHSTDVDIKTEVLTDILIELRLRHLPS